MITFNIKAHNGNYLVTHAPSGSNCWGDVDKALVLTIEQAREIMDDNKFTSYMHIEISHKSEPLSKEDFGRELFCIKGGGWFDYEKV
jgi:hypothetical protein